MFVISLTYKAPLEQVECRIQEHTVFLQKYYDSKQLLLREEKNPEPAE